MLFRSVISIVFALLSLAVFTSNDYQVERFVVLKASSAEILNCLNNDSLKPSWIPWIPTEAVTNILNDNGILELHWNYVEGSVSGVQKLIYNEGNRLEFDVHFTAPNESYSKSIFFIDEVSEGKKLTWIFKGYKPFPKNALNAFLDMDKIIGNQLEEGLAKFKWLCSP